MDSEQKKNIYLDIYNQLPGYCSKYENYIEPRMELSSDIIFGVINGLIEQASGIINGGLDFC